MTKIFGHSLRTGDTYPVSNAWHPQTEEVVAYWASIFPDTIYFTLEA